MIRRASFMPITGGAPAGRLSSDELEREKQIAKIGESIDRVIVRCCRRLDLVPHETLRWLNSIDPNKPAEDPFRVKNEMSRCIGTNSS